MIIYNLLSNAIKNTAKDGRIRLAVRVADSKALSAGKNRDKLTGENGFAEISVTDNGRGIAAELLDRIFERFTMSSAKETRFPLDSGIGLELTKRLVELHKGQITVESWEKTPEKEGYTRFTVLLPLGKDHLTEAEIVAGFKNRRGFNFELRFASSGRI